MYGTIIKKSKENYATQMKGKQCMDLKAYD